MTRLIRNTLIGAALVAGATVLYDWLFGCRHHRYSWPQTRPDTRKLESYVVCLECGKEFKYDWKAMKVR